MTAYLTKPYEYEDIVRVLSNYLSDFKRGATK